MAPERSLWLVCLAVPPAAVLAAYAFGLRGRRFYGLAAACSVFLAAAAAVPLFLAFLGVPTARLQQGAFLSTVLIPFAAFLWMVAVVVTPISRLDEEGIARSAAACLLHMAAFLTTAPAPLAGIWIATSFFFASGNAEERFLGARRIAVVYLGSSTALLLAGIALAGWSRGKHPALEQAGVAAILLAVVIRQGIFPFHAWIPEVFERGRLGAAVRFNAPQIGTYVALVLAVPQARPGLLRTVAVLGLITAVYASFMALHQKDARRACGYLFVSQSALVIAGLDLPSREALVGALILWVCSGVALAGLSRAVLALEARRGRSRLDSFHGGYERMPGLAACFLVMCLSIADFPGTLGFLGGEMLVRGAVESFPVLGFFTVAATALNGLAALRMYFSLFCGRRDSGAHLTMGRAERFGFAAAVLVLAGFGLAPGGLVRVLARAGATVIASRADNAPVMPGIPLR